MRSLVLLALLLFASLAAAQTPAPRVTAEAVAKAIEDTYFDAARGKQLADDLRADAARGDFDAYTAPLDLATALTARLKPLDRHFNVRYESGADAALPGTRRAPPPLRDAGIKRVEILPGNLGLLEMRFFAPIDFDDPNDPARASIDAALLLLATTDAIVIDLRDNGGGAPAMVGYLSSAFTPKGADIFNTFVRRDGRVSEAPGASHPAPRLDVPLYIAVSARTGSAAEAFAYTLKNAKRAVIVGENTAGAANPGGPVEVGGGFNVFVSDGSPVSPITQRNWEGDGVTPDVRAEPSDALRTAQVHALKRVLERSTDEQPMTDTRWALDALLALEISARRPVDAFAGDYGEMQVVARDGELYVKQGRRPERRLQQLPDGDYFYADDPSRRVHFERDALELRFADGGVSRWRRP